MHKSEVVFCQVGCLLGKLKWINDAQVCWLWCAMTNLSTSYNLGGSHSNGRFLWNRYDHQTSQLFCTCSSLPCVCHLQASAHLIYGQLKHLVFRGSYGCWRQSLPRMFWAHLAMCHRSAIVSNLQSVDVLCRPCFRWSVTAPGSFPLPVLRRLNEDPDFAFPAGILVGLSPYPFNHYLVNTFGNEASKLWSILNKS